MTALLITLFFPLAGAIALLFFGKEKTTSIKYTSFIISALTFFISIIVFLSFDKSNPDFQMVINIPWIKSLDAGFRIGVDGLSLMLLMLTTFISPIAILASFDAIHKREKEYYIMVLLMQFAMTGVFIALDIFLFYVFWEIILIPMYFIIGIWGGQNRIYAALKFFLYTIGGSLFMLIAIIWLGFYAGTNLIPGAGGFTANLMEIRKVAPNIPLGIQLWMFAAFALSFSIKVPIFPLHTWLPDAHTEAPTPGSVILAAVLLKMGTYGLIRFNLDLFPQASFQYAPYMATLGVIGIIYGALVAMVQTDVKRLVAFSSVSHLGFVVLGIFSMTAIGLQGAIIQMVNHGLSTGMLFLSVGIIYERRHTREISEFGGLARVMPAYSTMFAIAMLASAGLPGLNGFVGEYLVLLGAFRSPILNSWAFSIVSASGVIFAVCYLLWMFQRVIYGTVTNDANKGLKDLSGREWATLLPIVLFILWIGIYPATYLNVSENSTKALVNKIEMIKSGKTVYNLREAGNNQTPGNNYGK